MTIDTLTFNSDVIALIIIVISILLVIRLTRKRKPTKYKKVEDIKRLRDPDFIKFKKSGYSQASGNNYDETIADKGHLGEYLVFLELESLPIIKRIYVNVYVPKGNGYTEVDLIMSSEYGVYVFESKNYNGWIYGNELDNNWTQVLNKHSKFDFYNPIRQNKSHIDALSKLLHLKNEGLYKSFIVFSDKSNLENVSVQNDKIHVTNKSNLKETLLKEISKSERTLTIDKLKAIDRKLKRHILVSDRVKKDHIRRVEWTRQEYKRNIEQMKGRKCPLCGSNLIMRTSMEGTYRENKFIGCVSFPTCKFTENI